MFEYKTAAVSYEAKVKAGIGMHEVAITVRQYFACTRKESSRQKSRGKKITAHSGWQKLMTGIRNLNIITLEQSLQALKLCNHIIMSGKHMSIFVKVKLLCIN